MTEVQTKASKLRGNGARNCATSHNRPKQPNDGSACTNSSIEKIKVLKLFSVIQVEQFYQFMMHCIKTQLHIYLHVTNKVRFMQQKDMHVFLENQALSLQLQDQVQRT